MSSNPGDLPYCRRLDMHHVVESVPFLIPDVPELMLYLVGMTWLLLYLIAYVKCIFASVIDDGVGPFQSHALDHARGTDMEVHVAGRMHSLLLLFPFLFDPKCLSSFRIILNFQLGAFLCNFQIFLSNNF